MENWIHKAVHRPVATSIIFLAVVVAGLFAAFNLPLEILPSVEFPRLYIQTGWQGASPRSVEAYVTSPIEAELSSLKGIHKIKSFSYPNYSQIEVELQKNADVDYLRFFIAEKLSLLMEHFPAQVQPPRIIKYIPEEFKKTRFMSYHIVGPFTDAQLRQIALKKVRPALNSIPGVAGTEVIGGRERQIQIIFTEEKLKNFHLSSMDLFNAVNNAALIKTEGEVIEAGRKHRIVLRQQLASLHDIALLPVQFIGQRPVLLRDVAQVQDTLSPAFSFQRINGQATILIQIDKEPQANTIQTADRVYRIIRRLQSRLPAGVRLLKEDDQSLVIRDNLRQLGFRAVFSFVIILVVLTLFLRYLRFAFIIQGAIVISILATFLLMFIFHYTLNLFTLAGLALGFGMLVDNAIVVLENIQRYRDNGYKLDVSCASAPVEVAQPILASTLTTIVALFPFLYLVNNLRLYYEPFAVTVIIALTVSLIVAFFLIPMLTYQLTPSLPSTAAPLRKSPKQARRRGIIDRAYQRLLKTALKHPAITLLLALWIFGLPFWMLPDSVPTKSTQPFFKRYPAKIYNSVMGSSLMTNSRPYLNHLLGGSLYLFYRYVNKGELWHWGGETYLQAFVQLPSGTPIAETDRVTRLLERVVLGMSGVQQVRTRVYPNNASVVVHFTRAAQNSVIPFLAKEKLISRATQIGNSTISVAGFGPGFSSGGGGMTFQNRLLLTGYNYHDLLQFTRKIKQRLEKSPRVQNVRTDLTRQYFRSEEFETALTFKRNRLAAQGLQVQPIVDYLQPYLVRYLYRQRLKLGLEEIPFTINAQRYFDFQLYQMRYLKLSLRGNINVDMNTISNIITHRTPAVIERENQQYYKVISFEYLAPYQFAHRYVKRFLASTHLPPGYSLKETFFTFGGPEQKSNITFVLAVALLLMYMVMASLYESFTYPLLIFLIIPLSLVGVFLIYYLTNSTFNNSAYIGVIFMFGIILNNGIILLDRVNQLKFSGQYSHLGTLLVQAGTERLRPILMTTITTIVGLLPILVLRNSGSSQDTWYALSLATIGGLTSGTLLGMVVLPVCVAVIEKKKAVVKRILTAGFTN